MKAIEIQGLEKRMPDGQAILRDVSLEVEDGEFVALVGPQANGKSTLLRLISGLDAPTAGTIRVMGKEVRGIHRDVGFIFQETVLYPWLKVLENVTFGPLSRGVEPKEAEERATEWLSSLGLGKFLHKWPYELSGGMQRRVAIAMVMVNDPKVLLCDELLGGLDLITRNLIADEFLSLWYEKKRTVVYVTHLLEEAVYLSQRVFVMSSRPARIAAEIPIDLPEKRWEIPNLRFSKECAGYVRQVREKFEEMAPSRLRPKGVRSGGE
jgi:NitT/TauT family transport system ATP-binding protein